MKKLEFISIMCSAAITAALLTGCVNSTKSESEISGTLSAENTETQIETTISENKLPETSPETVSESEQATEADLTEIDEPDIKKSMAELGINEDGTLSEEFVNRINELMKLDHEKPGVVYPSLYDFDDDGIPEIFLIIHNGGQGYMPCKVYSAADLSYLGEFKGFCRDGFTRFEQTYGGTLIYNYYEHSVHQRQKDMTFAQLSDGKLETTWLWGETGTIRWGEYRPTISTTENKDDEALESLAKQATRNRGYTYSADDLVRIFRSYRGVNAFTSYDTDAERDELASAAAQSYNNYIKFNQLVPDDEDDIFYHLTLVGDRNQMAFRQDKHGLAFINENGEKTLLSTTPYSYIYKLWDNLVVCQPSGTVLPCDVYTVKDGKAELIEEISGKGMYLDYSRLYNGGFTLQHSIHDGMTMGAGHTYKKYQFYFDKDGVHEYGSIVVPLEEFYAEHGGEIKEFEKRMAEDGYEIYEVLYRADDCYVLNMHQPIYFLNEEEQEVFAGAYYQKYAAMKPMLDGTLSGTEIELDGGRYLTALCPDIAVYPEKIYALGEDD